MWVVGVIMMGVMFWGMFATGESHHVGMFGRGASHSVEQMKQDQVRDGDGQHKMMHDQDQVGHDHGKVSGITGDKNAKEDTPLGDVRDEGRQPITLNSQTTEGGAR